MQTQATLVNWEDPTTWTNWQQRFSAVAQCVYTVVLDTDDLQRDITDYLVKRKRIRPHPCPDSSLYNKNRAVADLLHNLNAFDADDLDVFKTDHGRPATLVMICKLDGLIQDMKTLMPAVQQMYSVDCSQLISSIEVAHTQLDNYIDAEERGAQADAASAAARSSGPKELTDMLTMHRSGDIQFNLDRLATLVHVFDK